MCRLAFWEPFVAKYTMLIALAFGALLIMLYPAMGKHSKPFALFGLVVGLLVVVLTIYVTFVNPVMREQIFPYGWR